MSGANDRQVGGGHYKIFHDLQPWDVVRHFGLGFFDGNAWKYIARWRHKGGIDDLRKARHYLDKLIEIEEQAHKELVQLGLAEPEDCDAEPEAGN